MARIARFASLAVAATLALGALCATDARAGPPTASDKVIQTYDHQATAPSVEKDNGFALAIREPAPTSTSAGHALAEGHRDAGSYALKAASLTSDPSARQEVAPGTVSVG